MKDSDYGIFAARFQPYHYGHDRLLKAYLDLSSEPLVIGVVVSYVPPAVKTDDLARTSFAHHSRSRNPLDVWSRVEMISDVWRSELVSGRVAIIPLPRPQGPPEWWDLVTTILPQKRFWIIKWRDDPFEEAKASYFREVGERTMELPSVDLNGCARGYELREMLARGESLDGLVPGPIATWLARNEIGATE